MDPISWLKEDIAEIKKDIKSMQEDIKSIDSFRLKVLGGAMAISFLVAMAMSIILAFIERGK